MSNTSQSLDPEPDLSAEKILQIENPISTHDEEQQKSQPQSPQTLITPKTQDHENPEKSDTNLEDPQIMEHEEQESSGMFVSRRPSFATNNTYRRNLSKRGGRRKQLAIDKKVQNLLKNLNLNPFVPAKTLDFPKHEKLLRHLGLWDFVYIDFGKSIRADLVAQLIVSFDLTKKCSYVNGFRFAVNRTNLARALKLPLPGKKEKGCGNAAGALVMDLDLDWEHSSEECVSFVEDFVSGWVLLHGEAWMMPSEVWNWMGLIKSGHPEKVDWASLFWHMVESELKQGVLLGSCYYASHLQCLIKSQREELLREEPSKVEMEEVDEVEEVEEVKEDEELLREEAGKVELEAVEVKEAEELEEVKEAEEIVEVKEAEEIVEVKENEVVKVKEDEELLREEPRKMELEVEEVKEDTELLREEARKVEEVKEDENGGLNESSRGEHNVVLEESTIELNLGPQHIVEKEEMKEDIVEKEETKVDDMMDVEECKDDKQGNLCLAEKNNVNKHFLQPCILGEGRGLYGNEERNQEVEQVEVEENMEMEEEGEGRGLDSDERKEEVEQVVVEEEREQVEVAEDKLEVEVEREQVEVAEDKFEEVEVEDEVEEVEDEAEEVEVEDELEVEVADEMEEVEVEEEGEQAELEENEDEEDGIGCNIAPNYGSLEGADLTGDLLQGFGTSHLPLNLQGQLHEHSSMELFASNAETHLIMGTPIFGSGQKRVMDYEQDTSHLNGSNKRMRTTAEWDHKSSDFGFCMGQVEQLMEKAKIIYEEKEQAFQEQNMNQQYLLRELQQRDNLIQNLQKSKNEELQKKELRIFRLERELCLMGTLLDGYRKSLKETNKAFFEYRQRSQLPEEPIYMDAGPGGLVSSITELEKQRQNQERKDGLNRLMIEQQANEAFEGYVGKFEVLLHKVQMLDTNRLTSIENEVKLLKDLFAAKCKASKTAGCVPGD